MVVQGILALALALPTGLLFGVGYGTGVRIGYEQVYPLLFPKDAANRNVTPTVNNIKQINKIYDTIGGKEASQMGIAMGLNGAMEEINRNPDFQALEALELRLSGRTQQRLGKEEPSKETSISDFPSDSSADPNSPNYNPAYANFIRRQQGKLPTIEERKELQNAPFPRGFDFGDKSKLNTYRPTSTIGGILYPSLTKSETEAIEFTKWHGTLIAWQNQFLIFRNNANSARKTNPSHVKVWEKKARAITTDIRRLAQDYRNPNNGIRTAVLTLRQELADGKWQLKWQS